jgi:metal-sulfur cluster biosynthetic enzyme
MSAPRVNEAEVMQALRQVIDPELGCNLVDLGLIYSVEIHGAHVAVKMTLTTPGCPMHESLAAGVQMALLNLEGVDDVSVEIVWEPRWHPGLMTEEGRQRVGLAQAP